MKKVEPRVLKGFRDYLPEKMIPRQRMLASIESTFQRFGYLPLMTPALESFDILTGKYGGEGEGLMYHFKDLGDRDVALRYDLTVPLARVVAQYPGDISLPFRRYQIAPVWRAEKPARGRFREFVQCDADIVGSKEMLADAEMVQVASELLHGLGVENFRIRLNNRKILSGLMASIGVDSPQGEADVLRTMDKMDKIGVEKVRILLKEENGLSGEQIQAIDEFLSIQGKPGDILKALRPRMGEGGIGAQGVEEVAEVFSILEAVGLEGGAEVDLSIARGLAYYTGTIYEVFLTDLPGYGAVMAGGRYDSLIGVFKGEELPAVGISLGIDRLLEGLVELNLLRPERSVAPILVAVFDASTAAHAARAARILRAEGLACELYPSSAKLKKQLRQAERAGQRWMILVGPEEAERGCVAVKDLEARKQEEVPLSELAATMAERLGKL